MKKALNFDLNTNKYEQITGKTSPTAALSIKVCKFFKKLDKLCF